MFEVEPLYSKELAISFVGRAKDLPAFTARLAEAERNFLDVSNIKYRFGQVLVLNNQYMFDNNYIDRITLV